VSRPARRQQRRTKTRPSRGRGITPTAPPEPPPGPSPGRIALGALVWLVGSVAYFLLFAVRETTARAWVDGARLLTGGQPAGMAVAGWLTIFAVFGLIWAVVLLRKRVHRAWLYTLGVAAVALSPTAVALFPLEGYRIVHLISGPGGSAFVHGMRWAAPAGFVPALVVPFALLKKTPPVPTAVIAGLFVLLTLLAAPLTA
jgi:hypothetical protein